MAPSSSNAYVWRYLPARISHDEIDHSVEHQKIGPRDARLTAVCTARKREGATVAA